MRNRLTLLVLRCSIRPAKRDEAGNGTLVVGGIAVGGGVGAWILNALHVIHI